MVASQPPLIVNEVHGWLAMAASMAHGPYTALTVTIIQPVA
jgi:hypothetical protein